MLKSKIAVGPMSPEIVEAVYRYSDQKNKQLMLISSLNQINKEGGYVNNWTTRKYREYLDLMKLKYPASDVLICRDHLGPGFNGSMDMKVVEDNLMEDIECGFDLIHFDFCHIENRDERISRTKNYIKWAKAINPNIMVEIGTDENDGEKILTVEELKRDVEEFLPIVKPEFYVVQTGSKVIEKMNSGMFFKDKVRLLSDYLHSVGVKVKEHNADYLRKDRILWRNGIVDAMNIAPQLGVVQTQCVLNNCDIYGVWATTFLETSYNSKKWCKWQKDTNSSDKLYHAIVAGHYNFTSSGYRDIMRNLRSLRNHCDIHERIISEVIHVVRHYEECSGDPKHC